MSTGFRLQDVVVHLGGAPVLRGVDLEVGSGERVALLGPSGAGKTTLLRAINGVIVPRSGSVEVQGTALRNLDQRRLRQIRSRIGFVHQDHSLVANLRVLHNVVAGRLGRRGFWSSLRDVVRTSKTDLVEVHRILERVGIGDKLFQRTDSLSGGQQQRVALARALFQQPTILLADEPVASVDPTRSRDILDLMTELAEEEGWTLVASIHDLALAREFFPRVIGLRNGEVFFDGPADALTPKMVTELYSLDGLDNAGKLDGEGASKEQDG
ncbi:MAG: phosphonate ABC transporter ATP-binding protein [Planctomycetota bacterium]|nr:phosphonate ABC transporter ATP-binding protein [Planctomycetota bacterium]